VLFRSKFVSKIIKNIKKNGYQIDGLVNCIGITRDTWDNTIATNLTSIHNFTKEILEIMKERKTGSVVNITSINSFVAFPNNLQYVASKGGLRMLTKAFALDYGKYNIRVNNICPGYIKTKMTEESYKKRYKLIKDKTILGRWGDPQDLVGPVLFLLSNNSSYITGIDLIVDGGWLAKGI
jgi:NAD(P)-dependent dehydrogenase (short-subunit alcohol dehydrogenase family)